MALAAPAVTARIPQQLMRAVVAEVGPLQMAQMGLGPQEEMAGMVRQLPCLGSHWERSVGAAWRRAERLVPVELVVAGVAAMAQAMELQGQPTLAAAVVVAGLMAVPAVLES